MTITAGLFDVTLYAGRNDHLAEISLTKVREQEALTGATVEITLTDEEGVEVPGLVWPLAMAPESLVTIDVDGVELPAQRYSTTMDAVIDLEPDKRYIVRITSTHPDGYDDQFWFDRVAVRRG